MLCLAYIHRNNSTELFFTGCLTLQWTKSLIHEKKVSVCCCPPPRRPLAGLLFRMFGLGFNSSSPSSNTSQTDKIKILRAA